MASIGVPFRYIPYFQSRPLVSATTNTYDYSPWRGRGNPKTATVATRNEILPGLPKFWLFFFGQQVCENTVFLPTAHMLYKHSDT